MNRARVYDAQSKFNEAQADFATVFKLEPENHRAAYYRGFMYFKRHKYDLAIPDMMKFLEWEDTDREQISHAEIVLSTSYLELGNTKAALKSANEAIRNFPSSARAYYARAAVYRKMGKKKLAAADERKAKRVSEKKP